MRLMIGLMGLVLLAGCAQAPKEPEISAPAEASRAEVAKPAPAAATKDPYTFDFDTMSIKLSPEEDARVTLLVEEARTAKGISIRGFCNRNEVGNAKDAAIARAVAVRDALRKAGVSSNKFRIRYTTDEARHAAVVEFH